MRIYLDHNATTPVRDEVVEAMVSALRDRFGNPSSPHAEGGRARAAIEAARDQIASLLGVGAGEILLTGGATEANNTALLGLLRGRTGSGRHVVTTAIEHPSVEAPLALLEREGWRVTRVGVDA
ncbi:MAG: aminotransferase class V-fold PLP-dependent enzyme, partial [Myxococcota bacterium]